jgi:hypothetical protein
MCVCVCPYVFSKVFVCMCVCIIRSCGHRHIYIYVYNVHVGVVCQRLIKGKREDNLFKNLSLKMILYLNGNKAYLLLTRLMLLLMT